MYGSIGLKPLVLPALVVFVTSVFVSIIPSVRAMRISPVKAMRSA